MKRIVVSLFLVVFSSFRKIFTLARSINYLESMFMLMNDKLCLRWANDSENRRNFGDALSPVLLKKITGKEVVCSWNVVNLAQKPVFCFIGSVLDNLNRRNSVICGAGFQKVDAIIKVKPSLVLAVRGPLSRDILIRNKVECPEIYGDPAILLPLYYKKPNPIKAWDVGIIAHYIDKPILDRSSIIESGYSYKIIDIEAPIETVIDDICSSRFIFSSSLHGIIVAHAYSIPATWIKLSEGVIGDGFKYRDYALSISDKLLPCYEESGAIDLQKGIEMSVVFDLGEMASNLYKVLTNYFRAQSASKS